MDYTHTLKSFLTELSERAGIPGIAVALTARTRTRHAVCSGSADIAASRPVSPETLFEIGSIGKSFTSIALLQEWEMGRLDLHAPVTEYLSWFSVPSPFPPITIHHLLTHTAGIQTGSDFSPDSRTQVWALRESAAAWAPGERFHYSNDGYKALGLILETVTGEPYGRTIEERILIPVGMRSTAATVTASIRSRMAVGHTSAYDDRPAARATPPVPAPWFETDTADGCLASTAEDMAAYARMLLNQGQSRGERIMTDQAFALLTQRAILVRDRRRYGYGLATWKDEDGAVLYGHDGGMPGFSSSMVIHPESGVGAIALVNRSGVDAALIANYALRLLRGDKAGAARLQNAAIADPTLTVNGAGYMGTYQSEARRFEAELEGKRLVMRYDGAEVVLEPRGSDRFYVSHPDFALAFLQFGRDSHGVVTEAFHHVDWFTNDRFVGSIDEDVPAHYHALTGHYRSFSPWISNFRVFLRKGSLFVDLPQHGIEAPLLPAGAMRFTMGDAPGFLEFGPVVNGAAISASLMGGVYSRVNMP